MPHLLAKLNNVPLNVITDILKKDKEFHASQGMYLEYIWQNTDNITEVFFLFKIDSAEKIKVLVNKLHAQALAEDPKANLPTMIYLQ